MTRVNQLTHHGQVAGQRVGDHLGALQLVPHLSNVDRLELGKPFAPLKQAHAALGLHCYSPTKET